MSHRARPAVLKFLINFDMLYCAGFLVSCDAGEFNVLPILFPALSCQEVTDDEVLDASCLLDVLRMYRWQISSFEEQVSTTFEHV